jgi:hypothetical protein
MKKEELKNHLRDILEDNDNSMLPLAIRIQAYTDSLYREILNNK